MNEFETQATHPERGLIPVSITYELDGYKPLGLWVADEHGNDITEEIQADEYDRLYQYAYTRVIDNMTDAAEYMEER